MKKLFTLVFGLLVLAACNGKSEIDEKLESLNAELMKGHDVVMPKSMKLPKIKAEVLKIIEGMDEAEPKVEQARYIAFELTKANDDMYNWMDNYANARLKTEDKTSQVELYERLLDDIQTIGNHTDEAMDMADKFLNNEEVAE
ncbi:hypothetical protein [Jiulongibacter sp. NS-SX5]|uniref:hypothetical protein n=1 Tax=Jiulongibacter sp. NS-SX5 TaxID=3463854 RepID=UPI004059F513